LQKKQEEKRKKEDVSLEPALFERE
jgi:hypothetical protein